MTRKNIRVDGSNVPFRNKINFVSGANTTVTVTDDEANDETEVLIEASAGIVSSPSESDITVSAEEANVIDVAVQLNDSDGAPLTSAVTLFMYLSDASTGIGVTGTAPDGGWAIDTAGSIAATVVAGVAHFISTDATGLVNFTIEESGADTWYLVVIHPDGRRQTSTAITFAA